MSDALQTKQIARILYLRYMDGMKQILQLGEFKIGPRGSDEYKYFKRIVMDQFYGPMVDYFEDLVKQGVLVRCPCETNVRRGYKENCECRGSGYINSPEVDAVIAKVNSNGKE